MVTDPQVCRLKQKLMEGKIQEADATVAAIDRVVHHSVILEFDVPSYRTGEARKQCDDNHTSQSEHGKEADRQK